MCCLAHTSKHTAVSRPNQTHTQCVNQRQGPIHFGATSVWRGSTARGVCSPEHSTLLLRRTTSRQVSRVATSQMRNWKNAQSNYEHALRPTCQKDKNSRQAPTRHHDYDAACVRHGVNTSPITAHSSVGGSARLHSRGAHGTAGAASCPASSWPPPPPVTRLIDISSSTTVMRYTSAVRGRRLLLFHPSPY